MQTLKKQLKQKLTLIFLAAAVSVSQTVSAESDMQQQEKVLRAREMLNQSHIDHEGHVAPIDKSLDFHGVFYGFIPCADCNGIKNTLSLKQNHNYLLVTQKAKESSREYYEKGKYDWNEATGIVALTPRNGGAIRQYRIENEGTLVQLNSDGSRIIEDEDRYTLRRSDTVKNREVHIH